jgi:hypothetical protein
MLKRIATAEDSEWTVRLTVQLFHLSAATFKDPRDRARFIQLQMSLVDGLRECRDAQLELGKLIATHTKEIEAGVGVKIDNGQVHVLNDIDPKLNRLVKDLFIKARTALYHLYGQKNASKSVTHLLLGRSISFAQAKDNDKFERSAAQFLNAVSGQKAQNLMNMLRGDRASWSLALIRTRDRIIHDNDCPQLKMKYVPLAWIIR